MRRTHRQLREALIALILEQGWDAVSVQDVCERADVGRSTFYVHFADKEDLLFSGINELHETLDKMRAGNGAFGFAEALIAHASEAQHVRLYRALLGRKSGQRMHQMFRDLIMRLVAADLRRLGVSEARLHATTRYVGGGFMEMMIEWLEKPSSIVPRGVAETFRELTFAAIGKRP